MNFHDFFRLACTYTRVSADTSDEDAMLYILDVLHAVNERATSEGLPIMVVARGGSGDSSN